jgi:opacity protein-like surface antigen
MKKWISTLAYAALLSPLSVVNAGQAFTGWSGGVNIGIIDAIAKYSDEHSFTSSGAPTAVPNYESTSARLGKTGGTIGLTLGYADCFSPCWNWGIEGRANFSNLKSSFTETLLASDGETGSLSGTIKMNQQYSVIAKLGYLLRPESQMYAFIGPQWSQLKANVSSSDQFTNSDRVAFAAGVNGSTSNYKTGLLVGLGLEQLLSDCMSVALEYDFSTHGNSNPGFLNGQYTENGTLIDGSYFNHNSQFKAHTNAMLLKFNYYFA